MSRLGSTKRAARNTGFTLLEILVAFFLFTIMMSALYTSYAGVFKAVKETEKESEYYQMARTTMDRLIEDLESTFFVPEDQAGKGKTGGAAPPGAELFRFEGKKEYLLNRRADTITFSSTAFVSLDPEQKPPGMTVITYYVAETGEKGETELTLFRSNRTALAKGPGEKEERGGYPLCEHLDSITFTYFNEDGDSFDNWDPSEEAFKGKPPRVVAVRLTLANDRTPERPYLFETKVLLP